MSDSPAFDEETWREELQSHREEKDEFFGSHPQSPIPPEERDEFDGLSYFDPDPDYRVEATAEVYDEPDLVEIATTAGPDQEYYHIGTLHFELDGEERTLEAYRKEGQGHLFVPFTDETTGEESYGKGRYMEFDVESEAQRASDASGQRGGETASNGTAEPSPGPRAELEEGQTVTLDFNLAYSPFCAYSETFACPLPPEGNHLDTEVRAGERV